MLQGIVFVLASLYWWRYWNHERPPLYDVVSPAILLSMGLGAVVTYPLSMVQIFTLLSLFIDAAADYLMNEDDLRDSIILFSLSHGFRQLMFIWNACPTMSLQIVMSLTWLCTYIIFDGETNWIIPSYAGIIFFTLVNAYLATSRPSLGLILFIISDLIIIYDMMLKRLTNRRVRVLLVPTLFWIAERVIIWEVLD